MKARILTALVIAATMPILVMAAEETASVSVNEAARDWLEAREKSDRPGQLKTVEAFSRVCCAGDEDAFLEAIALSLEQGDLRYLLREAIEQQLSRDNNGTLKAIDSAFASDDPAIRARVADVLQIGPAARKAIPALANALQDEHADVRAQAANAIGRVGPAAEQAIPDLVAELLSEKDTEFTILGDSRAQAAGALGSIGEAAVPALTELLTSDSEFVRWEALMAMSAARPEAAVPLLFERLMTRESGDPYGACDHEDTNDVLWGIGTDLADEIGASICGFRGSVSPIALAEDIELLEEVVGLLAWVIENDFHMDSRYEAARGIETIGGGFRDDILMWDEEHREELFEVLERVGDAAVPALIVGLSDEAFYVRNQSIDALGSLGPAAGAAAPALKRLFAREKKARAEYRDVHAAGTLYLIGGDAARFAAKALIEIMKADVQSRASTAFNYLTEDEAAWSEAAVPVLVAALQEENARVRQAAAIALGNLGPMARTAVPFLEEILTDQDPDVRQAVTRALARAKDCLFRFDAANCSRESCGSLPASAFRSHCPD